MATWGFYGRQAELAEIERLLKRGSFFFCSISGRRRIGKTSLIHEALKRQSVLNRSLYVQVPDSDERGVIQVFEDAIEDTFSDKEFAEKASKDFSGISILLSSMWQSGFITAVDEFQYFHRKALSEFLSYLQREVDVARREKISGGLFALGSIHTEMTAVLEDKQSPLFNRVTDRISVGHWDFETLFEMFQKHGITDTEQMLFLWSIFEGVPKFYRDCFDHGVLVSHDNYREHTLERMFFAGASPLKDEAENWFLRELRGRNDSVLKFVARMSSCSHGELKAEYARKGPGGDKQLGGYLKILINKYQMIEKVDPIFAPDKARRARYMITDNFLKAWLSSISRNVQLARVRPIPQAVTKTSASLETHEGFAFEKMTRLLLEECSRKQVGDFTLTNVVKGYWNKPDGSDIEIDVVAINDDDKVVRFGSCKRSDTKHDQISLGKFQGHIDKFLKTKVGRRFSDWKVEKALYSPAISPDRRKKLQAQEFICTDLRDFEQWLREPKAVTLL